MRNEVKYKIYLKSIIIVKAKKLWNFVYYGYWLLFFMASPLASHSCTKELYGSNGDD